MTTPQLPDFERILPYSVVAEANANSALAYYDGQVQTNHHLLPGTYMVSMSYAGANAASIRVDVSGEPSREKFLEVPAGTRGYARKSTMKELTVGAGKTANLRFLIDPRPAGDETTQGRGSITIYPIPSKIL